MIPKDVRGQLFRAMERERDWHCLIELDDNTRPCLVIMGDDALVGIQNLVDLIDLPLVNRPVYKAIFSSR